MADDELAVLGILAQILGRLACDEAVGGAVEAVTAHLQAPVVIHRNGIHERLGRHGLMERSVKYRDIGLAGHDLLAGADAGKIGRHVQRSERNEGFHALHGLVRHQYALLERLAAVEHAVADRADFIQRGNHARLPVGERVHHRADRLGVVRHVADVIDDLAGGGHGLLEVGAADADALDQALGEHLFIIHVDYLELQRRRSRIDNQYLHVCPP